MLSIVAMAVGILAIASSPYWLPAAILALRTWIFTVGNGAAGLAVPGEVVGASRFKQLYSHPAACGRSKGAALSDLFWYWLSPGPEFHQENIEPGETYEEVAKATRGILAMPRDVAQQLAAACMARKLKTENIHTVKLVRLRKLAMPVWAEFYYELVFGEPCTPQARELIVGNADDVITALKCCGLRHMHKRHALTSFLVAKLQAGQIRHELPHGLSTVERALYLQGAFFNTAVVQMSEATAHLFMIIAQHPPVQERLTARPDDRRYLDHVIEETLRLYPLFGISHRITQAEITLDDRTTLPKATVLYFNHLKYHCTGFDEPQRFDPDRWEKLSVHEANYIPYGVAANRPCPAAGLASLTLRAAARELLRQFAVYSSAEHTRSNPNQGPCLLVSRANGCDPRHRSALLVLLRVRDRWEDVWRSLVQLVLGTYMIWDARRLKLCQRYFAGPATVPTRPQEKVRWT
ncbi:MAG TPA: cytochrome P450 [Burkholderiaceae bacterium]|nr:cytochrome P450 [Burkholderiaceae bacterium]